MIRQRSSISFFLALVVAFGVTLSSVHIHLDAYHDIETKHFLADEEFNCVICGSTFKFNPEGDLLLSHQDTPEIYFFTAVPVRDYSPVYSFKDGRAPPLFS